MNNKLPDIKAILFDMDGTLIDAEKMYKKAWQLSAKECGFILNNTIYNELIGRPLPYYLQIIEKYLPTKISISQFESIIDKHNLKLLQDKKCYLMKGAKQVLEFMKKINLPTGLVTSSYKKNVDFYFQNNNYLQTFDVLVTYEDTIEHKPSPIPYLHACKLLNVKPQNTLVFEDSSPGIISSLNAGCQTVLINRNLTENMQFLKKKLVNVFENLEQAMDELMPLFSHLS